MLRFKWRRLLRYWTYFRRGHSVYLIFAITFMNFIVIQYRLLVEYIPLLQQLFPRMVMFIVTFLIIYIPVSVLIGWLDYKRGAAPVDLAVAAHANPFFKDLAKAVVLLAEGKNKDAAEIMKKWVT